MITEELKHTLDSLPSEIHEQNTSLIRAVTKMITLYT